MSRIPPHARRVFQGILFDVYQWEQELFDGSTTTFEAVRRVPSVQILATTPAGQVILLREEQPHVGTFVAVPGGRVERGVSPEETVRRELREELGMEAESVALWHVETFGSTIEWTGYDFIARGCRQVAEPEQEPGERIEPYLASFEEFLDQVERPDFRNKTLANRLFRMRYTPGALEAFRELLFGHRSPP
jgi:ADP-ribose pyrophosphatase